MMETERHQPASDRKADAARMPEGLSTYARGLAERQGLDGLHREASRLLETMETASSLYRDGSVVRTILSDADIHRQRVDYAYSTGAADWLAWELDAMQAKILRAQKVADPCGRAALVLHTSREHWDRYDSYQAYRDAYAPA